MAAQQRPSPRQAILDLVGNDTGQLFSDGHDDAIVGITDRAFTECSQPST